MKKPGEQFLHQQDGRFHTSAPVEGTQKRLKRDGEKTSQKPVDKIEAYLSRVNAILNPEPFGEPQNIDRKNRNINLLKKSLYKDVVIKPEDIPESAFLLEQRIARNLGHGNVEITDEFKESKRDQIINDQINSLDRWIDYLTSEDADVYPAWAKYWAFKSMVTMGKYEKVEDKDGKETARFSLRSKDTVAGFPPLNEAAFAQSVGAMQDRLEQKDKPKKEHTPVQNISTKLSDDEFKNLLSSESFARLYTQFLIEQPEYSKEGLEETRGEWLKYPKGSEPDELVESLEGYPLEWCIRDSGTAKNYLSGGDMHIYYSINKNNEPIIPRLAIRMQDSSIAEVRGIAPEQNLDPYIGDVVEEKLDVFSDGEKYKKKTADMKRLTEIEKNHEAGEELTKDDIRFLYEIDEEIEGFGYQKDPRIEEILNGRDIKEDLSFITGYTKEQISITQHQALYGEIKYHFGDLDLESRASAQGLTLPESIRGNLNLRRLIFAEGLTLPESIGGGLYLNGLTSAEGLKFPESIGQDLNLNGLTSAEGLKLPESIGGYLFLDGLTSAEGLKLPESIGGSLYLSGLTSAEGLKFPESIIGDLDLSSLTSAEGLKLPKSIGGYLNLKSLKYAEKEKLRKKYPQLIISKR